MTDPYFQIVPHTVSNFIPNQFPAVFQENDPNYIAFLKSYYEWMESPGNPLYYSRRYYEIKDIDTTLEEFIIHFKNKYLHNIQLTTESDTKQLIKHALDIYRSKGTQRCVQLLFQLVFAQQASFYYPSRDLFKLSDGQWVKSIYLELPPNPINIQLVNKEIVGLSSGATAFVEEVVRRTTLSRLQDIAYLSAVNGNFQTYEKVQPTSGTTIPVEQCPTIVGSLTAVEIFFLGTGQNYTTGDIVSLSSNNGTGGAGRVSSTANAFGLVTFSLGEGGYGYTSNSNVWVSSATISIANVQVTNSLAVNYFQFLDTVTQPLAFLNYNTANGTFHVGDQVFTYFGNGAQMGTGSVQTVTASNTTAGTILVNVLSGNVGNTVYTTGNSISALLNLSNGYSWSNSTGLYIANDSTITITVNNTSNFAIGETVGQGPSWGTLTAINGSNLVLGSVEGMFKINAPVVGWNSQIVDTAKYVGLTIGLSNTVGTFYNNGNNYLYSNSITANIGLISASGSGISLTIANSFLYQETIRYNTDLCSAYSAIAVNALSYGLPANTQCNATTVFLNDALTYANTTIGKIGKIAVSGLGVNFLTPPMLVIDEPVITAKDRYDVILNITGETSNFLPGEIVTQTGTNARGLVQSLSNSSILFLQQLRFYIGNNFTVTTNSATQIFGTQSGSIANIAIVAPNNYSALMGHNAIVNSQFIVGNGAILTLAVTDSGFGFVNGESVVIGNSATGFGGSGFAILDQMQGSGAGYYRQKGGFLSDQKKLFDGTYYQNYSYEIISSLILDKYKTMIEELTHPAGTALFGKFVYDTQDSNFLKIQNSIIKTGIVEYVQSATMTTSQALSMTKGKITSKSFTMSSPVNMKVTKRITKNVNLKSPEVLTFTKVKSP